MLHLKQMVTSSLKLLMCFLMAGCVGEQPEFLCDGACDTNINGGGSTCENYLEGCPAELVGPCEAPACLEDFSSSILSDDLSCSSLQRNCSQFNGQFYSHDGPFDYEGRTHQVTVCRCLRVACEVEQQNCATEFGATWDQSSCTCTTPPCEGSCEEEFEYPMNDLNECGFFEANCSRLGRTYTEHTGTIAYENRIRSEIRCRCH